MTHASKLQAALAVAALLGLPLAQAATMSKSDRDTSRTAITATYKADRAACGTLADNAKDVCIEQAKGKEKIARAELEYAYTGKPADGTKLRVAKAEAAYAVAKEKCDDHAGNVKDVCVKEAKAAETKALADAKLGKQIGEAQQDASDDKRAADYKVAAERCEALAGDPKAACLANARARFGKN